MAATKNSASKASYGSGPNPRVVSPEKSRALVVQAEKALAKTAKNEQWARAHLARKTPEFARFRRITRLGFLGFLGGGAAAILTGGAVVPVIVAIGSMFTLAACGRALEETDEKAQKILAISDDHRAVIKEHQALLESPERVERRALAESEEKSRAQARNPLIHAAAQAALQSALDANAFGQIGMTLPRPKTQNPPHISFDVPDVGKYLLRVTEDAPFFDTSTAADAPSGQPSRPVRRVIARVCAMPADGAEYASAPLVEGIAPVMCERVFTPRLPGSFRNEPGHDPVIGVMPDALQL